MMTTGWSVGFLSNLSQVFVALLFWNKDFIILSLVSQTIWALLGPQ